MSEKVRFAAFETGRGAKIYRLPVEAFPNFWAYTYLIQKDEFCVLVDTGSGTDTSHENLIDGFQQAGIQLSELTHILLTHAHIDHFGGLAKLRPLTNAKIGCHELDVQTVSHHDASVAWVGRRLASFLAETGTGEETREQILSIYRISKNLCQSVPVNFTYEALDMRLGPFEFLHLPGHYPGHVAIRVDDVIFCGDMVVEGVTPHLLPESIHPYSGLDHYLRSLSGFQVWAKEARLIFNGHDDVITDISEAIQATKRNTLRRMSKAVEALQEPLTVDEICRAVYGETAGYSQLLVIEKTGAYVEYLYEHGMIEITNAEEVEKAKPVRYRRLRDEMVTMTALEKNVYGYTSVQAER